MLDGEADRVPIHEVGQALYRGLEATDEIVKSIQDLQNAVGKSKRDFEPLKTSPQLIEDAIER